MKKQIEKSLDLAALICHLEAAGVQEAEVAAGQIQRLFEAQVDLRVKQAKNQGRIASSDSKKASVPALSVLSRDEIEKLPNWVKHVINQSTIIGSSEQVIQTPDGKKYHRNNPLNDLSGGEWTFFLNSVISTRYPTSGPESFAHHIRKIHPSPKPPQLMKEIIEFFTKEGELVFDSFMGVGGTLLGASLSNRKAIGIDLNGEFIDAYKRASQELDLKEQKTFEGNALEIIPDNARMEKILQGEEVALIAIDPPYGDMMSREKTGESAKKGKSTSPTPFTESAHDFGNLPIDDFYGVFKKLVQDSLPYLKQKGHLVVFIKDFQPTKENSNLLHARVIGDLHSLPGLRYLGMKIWADNSVNLYPYGYPYSFVSNQIHQYIMIFKKD